MKYCPTDNKFVGTDGPAVKGDIPHVMWHVTDVCPLSCPYCFARKTDRGLPEEYITPIVEKLSAIGVQKVDLSGGEPLAYKHLNQVCRELWSAGIHTTLTTSGVGAKTNKEFVISNCKSFARLMVSLDAFGDDHDRLRQRPGAWEDALAFIRSLDTHTRMERCRINTVVTKPYLDSGWGDKLGAMVKNLGVREWCLIQPHPANKKSDFDEYSINDSDFRAEVTRCQTSDFCRQIITRQNSLYSTYWNIQPDGTLQQHTETAADRNSVSLIDQSTTNIQSFLKESITIVPT